MQDSSTPKPNDTTRAGGPDDTREFKTPNTEEKEEQEVNTNEKGPVWR